MISRTIVLAVILVLLGTGAYADECNSLRYSDNYDGTVTDCRTGLIWLMMANCKDPAGGIDKSTGFLTWDEAMKWVTGLQNGICGLADDSAAGDWRLPTKTELMAMVVSAKKQGFTNPMLTNGTGTGQWTSGDTFTDVRSNYYWSSTTNTGDTSLAWEVHFGNGYMLSLDKTAFPGYVWPVRGGQSGEFGSVFIQ